MLEMMASGGTPQGALLRESVLNPRPRIKSFPREMKENHIVVITAK
jgi:hypothetical protein